MRNKTLIKFSTYLAIAIFLIGQFSIFSAGLLLPKKADAFLGFGDLTIKIGDVYQALKDIALGALRAVALKASDRFLTTFVNKLKEKYRINNFLYYNRLLSDYYITQFIAEKIEDPNLQKLFSLLNSEFITGHYNGSNNQDPRKALIPILKQALADYYLQQGGIDPNKIYSPPAGMTDRQYFSMARAYFANPPSFTEQNLRAQYGAFQSSATVAAQLEVITGNGLKAGRVIGGYCTNFTDNASRGGNLTPQTCAGAGGKWNQSALDIARNFIDNPTATVKSFLDSSILTKIDSKFNPNNFWAQVGSTIGNFFSDLALDSSTSGNSSAFYDAGPPYVPGSESLEGAGRQVDIDNDGVDDGLDKNGDNLLNTPVVDICYYGGLYDAATGIISPNPPCAGSLDAFNTGEGTVECLTATPGTGRGNDLNAPTTLIDSTQVDFQNASGVVDINSFSETGTLGSIDVDISDIHLNGMSRPWDYLSIKLNSTTAAHSSVWIIIWRNNKWIAWPFAYLQGTAQTVPTRNAICGRPNTLQDFEPQIGDTYGFMLSTPAGNSAIVNNFNNLQEKSNIVMYQWGGASLTHPNHLQEVIDAKALVVAQGGSLQSCNSFRITEQVAWQLQAELAGLLSGGSGYTGRLCPNQFDDTKKQFVVDKIVYPDGAVYEILGLAGKAGGNIPQWVPMLPLNPVNVASFYTPAYDPVYGPPQYYSATVNGYIGANNPNYSLTITPTSISPRPGQTIVLTYYIAADIAPGCNFLPGGCDRDYFVFRGPLGNTGWLTTGQSYGFTFTAAAGTSYTMGAYVTDDTDDDPDDDGDSLSTLWYTIVVP